MYEEVVDEEDKDLQKMVGKFDTKKSNAVYVLEVVGNAIT